MGKARRRPENSIAELIEDLRRWHRILRTGWERKGDDGAENDQAGPRDHPRALSRLEPRLLGGRRGSLLFSERPKQRSGPTTAGHADERGKQQADENHPDESNRFVRSGREKEETNQLARVNRAA